MEEKIEINPKMLFWCREQVGLSLKDAATQAGILELKATKKNPSISPEMRLSDMEKGNISPTFSQLKALAKIYQRPLMTFFLDNPPELVEKLVDFRTIDSLSHQKDSPEFARLKRRLLNLQEELSIIEKDEKRQPLDFVSTISTSVEMDKFIQKVRKKLNFSYEEQKKAKDDTDLFKILRDKIQDLGVYVVLEGNLGSHHSNISSDEFRGIAISDDYAPLIVINPNDHRQARLFTLLHEFAHIWLGDSAISNTFFVNNKTYNLKEAFCNKFAAEFLIPQKEILDTFNVNTKDITSENIFNIVKDLAQKFKVSLTVMSRRLYDLGKINHSLYNGVISTINKTILRKKELEKQDSDLKISHTILDKYRLGSKVISTIMDATYSGKISVMSASILLNINSSRLDRI